MSKKAKKKMQKSESYSQVQPQSDQKKEPKAGSKTSQED